MKIKNILIVIVGSAALASCQNGGNSPSASTATTKDYYAIALAIAPSVTYTIPSDVNADCNFDSQVILNGSTVTAYLSSSVENGQVCISEQRSCVDGVLSGNYAYSTCEVAAPASCLFNGQTIAHGESLTAYQSSSVPEGDNCNSEIRVCNNGVLSGSNQFSSCSIDAAASCLFNGQTITSGNNVVAFLNPTEPSGSTCQLEYRSCDNGILSGSNQFASCEVNQPAACLFDGQTIPDGGSVVAFLNSSEEFGGTCSSEIRSCHNGVLSGVNQYSSCQVGSPSSCLFNGQTIAHGQNVNAYSSSTVDYGQMCNAETRVCDNGHLSGSFEFASCDAGQGASCLFNGQTIASGSSVMAFESSNGLACNSEQRICENGVLSGNFAFASCQVNQAASCLFNGQTISDGQSVVAYKNATEAENIRCEAETRTCSNGTLSGTFTNTSCSNTEYVDEEDDDEMIKICKHVVEIKHKEHYLPPTSNGLHLGWLKYKERFNCGKHKGWYKHKNKDTHPTCKNRSGWYKDKK